MKREQIHEVLSNYDPKEIKIGVKKVLTHFNNNALV